MQMQVKYEIGDIVEIRNEYHGHCFDLGDKVRVRSLESDGRIETCEYLDGSDYWFVDDEEVRHIQGELQ